MRNRHAPWLFAILVCATLAVAWEARHRAWEAWEERPEASYSRGVAASGSDSYYWFRIAREIRDRGGELGPRDPLRAWPEGLERGPIPAFAWLIARSAALFDGDVYRAGIALNVLLSGLFIVPLALYGRRIALPLAGLLGGFFGALGHVYVQRSSVQRVDTDGGTLFFLYLLAFGIASLRPESSPRRNLVVAVLSGLALAAFCRWYGQPGFWWIWLGTLVLHLLAGGFAPRRAAALALAFALFANPRWAVPGLAGIAHFLRYYVLPSPRRAPDPFDYASVTRDITELQPFSLEQSLAQVVDWPVVSALGLLGFAAFALVRWRAAIALLPIALLGIYSLFGPQRFGMYLAPLVGIGWGYALHALAAAWERSGGPGRTWAQPAAALATVLGASLMLSHTGFADPPRARVPIELIASLQRLADRLPPDAAVLASWGRGYLIEDVAHAATLNDGEQPDPLVHYLFARAIASSEPEEIVRIVAALSTYGRGALHAALDASPDPGAAVEALLRRPAATDGNVVLLLTGLDVDPFPAYFRAGRWRFDAGAGPEEGFLVLHCAAAGRARLGCIDAAGERFVVERATGRVSGGRWLRRVVEIRADGRVDVSERAPGAALTLELIPDEKAGPGGFTGYLLSEAVFRSNFNQLFLLGRYDPALFEEIQRDLPHLRAYRIRARGPRDERAPLQRAAFDGDARSEAP